MAVHSYHPSIQEHGLADGCDRCAELAADPFSGLDTSNLLELERRTHAWMSDDPYVVPRSENETVAMQLMENHIRRERILSMSRVST